MFFTAIAPLLAKGVTFDIKVAQAEGASLSVAVHPLYSSEKAVGYNLVPREFVALPSELDAEFATIMCQYAQVTATLHEQLEAARLVAEATAKEASKPKEAPSKKVAGVQPPVKKAAGAKPAIAAKPAAQLIGDDAEDIDDESDDSGTAEIAPAAQPTPQEPASAPASETLFDL